MMTSEAVMTRRDVEGEGVTDAESILELAAYEESDMAG